MRWIALAGLAGLVGCSAGAQPAPEPPLPIDAIWAQAIQPGGAIVAVPGTGARDNLGSQIDAASATQPVVIDGRLNAALNPIVLEQAIAAAQRAGVDPGELTLALWGAGVTKTDRFTYRSLGGLEVEFVVAGGQNACAVGGITDNFANYTRDHADADARDLWARTTALGAPSVTIVAHSYGGAVAEHLVTNQLADASLAFVVAAGVPGTLVGEPMVGPGLRPEGTAQLYEVDRPDDPVHALDFAWDLEGHQYDIMYGDAFQGSYGITTEELSCHGQPGPCPH